MPYIAEQHQHGRRRTRGIHDGRRDALDALAAINRVLDDYPNPSDSDTPAGEPTRTVHPKSEYL